MADPDKMEYRVFIESPFELSCLMPVGIGGPVADLASLPEIDADEPGCLPTH